MEEIMSQDYNLEISKYIDKFEGTKKERLAVIRNLIHESVPEIKEKIWARIPSFYIEKEMIQILAFKDHINIFANQIINNKDALSKYKITDKGTLQIYDKQDIPMEILEKIFIDSVI
jgi:uncharacterized protein YdhG (YjbR/CyaY superfamily)